MLEPKILGWGPNLLCRVIDFECRGPNSFAGSVEGAPEINMSGPRVIMSGPLLAMSGPRDTYVGTPTYYVGPFTYYFEVLR